MKNKITSISIRSMVQLPPATLHFLLQHPQLEVNLKTVLLVVFYWLIVSFGYILWIKNTNVSDIVHIGVFLVLGLICGLGLLLRFKPKAIGVLGGDPFGLSKPRTNFIFVAIGPVGLLTVYTIVNTFLK